MNSLGQEVLQQPTQSPAFDEVDARKLHHFLDPAAIGFCVAVCAAILAFGLRIIGAVRQPLLGVGEQIAAFRTWLASPGAMILLAIQVDECGQYAVLFFVRCHNP